jgi:Zn-dependent peptidase ImmA (M78 family)/transcriptional regulator with XRE-family HTH domain
MSRPKRKAKPMRDDPDLARTLFLGGRLTQARELRGLLKQQLAEQVGLTPAAIGQFERGAARPSATTVSRLAFVLKVPVDFFAHDRPIQVPLEREVHFRSLRAMTKRQRSEALARLGLLMELVDVLERQVRLPVLALPEIPAAAGLVNAEQAAVRARMDWGLANGPLSHAVRLLESKGIVVVREPLGLSAVDAFSCWGRDRPFVVLNADKADPYRSRFDAAHELGHLILHHDARPGSKVAEEEAHRFASSFLMPASAIRSELPSRVTWARLFALKSRWGVSVAALLRRGHDLGVYSDGAYKRAMMHISAQGWRRHEPGGGWPVEEPQLLDRAFALLASRRSLSVAMVTQSLHLGLDDARSIAGLGPENRPTVTLTSGHRQLAGVEGR